MRRQNFEASGVRSAGDLAGAFEWCQRAADGDLAWAQYNLGLMYQKGEGVAPQRSRSCALVSAGRIAGLCGRAANGSPTFTTLAWGYRASYTQAALWYRRAAEQGSARAQFQLGHLYDVGLGIEHDYTQYRYWTRMAAEQGHEDAIREVPPVAITVTHKPNSSRLIAVRQPFHSGEAGLFFMLWRRGW